MLFHLFFKTILHRNHWRVFKTDGMMWAIVMQFSLENSLSWGKFTTNGAIVMSHKRKDVFLQHLIDLKSMHNFANSAKQASHLFSVILGLSEYFENASMVTALTIQEYLVQPTF